MKKIVCATLFAALIGLALPSIAQDTTVQKDGLIKRTGEGIKKGSKKAWKGTKKGAKAVGNETAELATKGKAKLTDKTSAEYVGPDGQTIYVDDNTRYYWVSEKGKRMFVDKDALKPKQ